ncbi:MAG: hypothetical protein NZ604_04650 [Flavobacteriales bacterium]|nr:hypothetical protein [Flavobacteriales bacterium]
MLKSANNTSAAWIDLIGVVRETITEIDAPRVVIAVLRGRPIPITRYSVPITQNLTP